MKHLHLVWRSLLRKKTRTVFTLLSILVAFVLFGYLSAITLAFSLGVDVTGENRLLVINKVSLILPLPWAYKAKLEATPGIVNVVHQNWFGGYYQDVKNQFANMAVDPEPFLRAFPDFVVPPEQQQAWLADRQGAIVGRQTAEKYGWKIGDRVPLQGTIYRKKDGEATWEFVIDGIYTGIRKGVDESQFFFHYKYLEEMGEHGEGLVGWYTVVIDDPERAVEIGGRVDALFANSSYETKTTTEKAFVQSFAAQIGNIGLIMRYVMIAVFFTMLLVAGNTMAQTVRERTSELAVLKTLGYRDGMVLGLVLAESLLLAILGGGLGLALSWTLITIGGDPTGQFLPVFYFRGRDVAIGAGLVVAFGLACGILPALRAGRLSIVEALRKS